LKGLVPFFNLGGIENMEPSQDMLDTVVKVCEGNPGALNIMMSMITAADPASAVILMPMFEKLKESGLGGSHLYCLQNDICEGRETSFFILLAGFYWDFVPLERMKKYAEQGELRQPADPPIDWTDLSNNVLGKVIAMTEEKFAMKEMN
jgi:hypothetical protein